MVRRPWSVPHLEQPTILLLPCRRRGQPRLKRLATGLLILLVPLLVGGWVALPAGTTEYLAAVHFYDARLGWVAGDRDTLLRTEDGERRWTPIDTGTTGDSLLGLDFYHARFGWAATGQGRILRTRTAGSPGRR